MIGLPVFVKDNLSYSKKNVLSGLHYQIPPFAKGKLLKVIKGRILDVVVDLRYDSKYLNIMCLCDYQIRIKNNYGFLTLSDTA